MHRVHGEGGHGEDEVFHIFQLFAEALLFPYGVVAGVDAVLNVFHAGGDFASELLQVVVENFAHRLVVVAVHVDQCIEAAAGGSDEPVDWSLFVPLHVVFMEFLYKVFTDVHSE